MNEAKPSPVEKPGDSGSTKGKDAAPTDSPESSNDDPASQPSEDYSIPIDPPDNFGGGWEEASG